MVTQFNVGFFSRFSSSFPLSRFLPSLRKQKKARREDNESPSINSQTKDANKLAQEKMGEGRAIRKRGRHNRHN